MNKGNTLIQLYENRLLCSKVDEALDTGVPYTDIVELCKQYDFEISPATLTRYKNKREEAIEKDVPLSSILDMRTKTGKIVDLNKKRQNLGAISELSGDDRLGTISESADIIHNDIQLLDAIIQKAYNGIAQTQILDAMQGVKAIEVKHKVTGNALQGLSLAGLRELKLREKARSNAVAEVLMQYIDEEKHEEVMQAINDAEDAYYENLDLTEAGQRVKEFLAD